MHLKIGSIVKIKSADEIHAEISKHGVAPGFYKTDMGYYCGKTARIIGIFDKNPPTKVFQWVYLDIDDGRWVWSANWLKKINNMELNNKLFEI